MANLDLNVDVDVKGQDKLRSLSGSLAGGALNVAKFGAVAGAAIVGVGAVTANFASDMNESLSKVGVVFGKSAKAVEKWSESSAENLGLSQQAALEATGTFGNLFTAMGIGEKPAVNMSEGLVQLAADLASFNNISTEEATEKLRAGIVGEAEPLRTLGVNISAVATEAKAMQLGFKKVDGQFTASQKAQANYALILEQTKTAQGDFARTSDGMANQQRILSATFEDTMADVGQAFTPIIEAILPQVTAGLKGFSSFITDNLPTIKGIITGVMTGIGNAFNFLITEILPRVGEAFSFIATNVFPLFSQAAGAVPGIFDAISKAVAFVATNVFPVLLAIFQKVVAWVTKNWPTISSVFGQVFGAIANAVKVVWPIVANIAKVLFPLVMAAATVLFRALDKTFKLIGGIFEVTGNVVDTMVKAIGKSWLLLQVITSAVWGAITGIIKGVLNGVIDVINGFFGFLNGFQIGVPEINVGPVHVGGGVIDPFNIGLIPHLAAGGIIDSPTLALLGEKGPEAVVPLDRRPVGSSTKVFNLEIQAPLRANDAQDIAEYIDRVDRLAKAMEWTGA